jgi:regulator of RNase E activity RraA
MPRGPKKVERVPSITRSCAAASSQPGDLILGDFDGVAVVPGIVLKRSRQSGEEDDL